MADEKISQLPVATSVSSPDVAPIVQGGVTKQADVGLFAGLSGSISDQQVAFGNGTAIDGSSNFTWDDGNQALSIAPNGSNVGQGISVGGGAGVIYADGSAAFGNGKFGVDPSGAFSNFPTIVALLPSSPYSGTFAVVYDGISGLAWGDTVVGGQSTLYAVWYNGINWTVFAK